MTVFVTRNGQRLTRWMNYQMERLDKDLRRLFGVYLIVTSAIRLASEQVAIFLQRYVTAGNINGRRVYDTRVWNGVRYYRISPAGTVAVPKTSNHEVQGTRAAVDIRDSGADAGITVRSSKRGQWLRANAGNYGLVASGDGFGEGWHFDMPNYDRAVPGSGSSGGGSGFSQTTKNRQAWLNKTRGEKLDEDGRFGDLTKAAYKRYQTFLRRFGYLGMIDGDWRTRTEAAHLKYVASLKPKPAAKPKKWNPFGLSSAVGLQKVAKLYGYRGDLDDIWGNGSDDGFSAFLKKNWGYRGGRGMNAQKWAAIARWLRKKYGYVGNDQPGPVMRAALKRANDKNNAELK